jgi:hypothetical protein
VDAFPPTWLRTWPNRLFTTPSNAATITATNASAARSERRWSRAPLARDLTAGEHAGLIGFLPHRISLAGARYRPQWAAATHLDADGTLPRRNKCPDCDTVNRERIEAATFPGSSIRD